MEEGSNSDLASSKKLYIKYKEGVIIGVYTSKIRPLSSLLLILLLG